MITVKIMFGDGGKMVEKPQAGTTASLYSLQSRIETTVIRPTIRGAMNYLCVYSVQL